MSAEQINKYIGHFLPIYDDKGNEINPIPDNTKITVWCDNGGDIKGFAFNVDTLELGLEAFIAKSWILQTELVKLANHENRNNR